MDKRSFGIAGSGWVGTACYEAFHKLDNWEAKAYDSNPDGCRLNQILGSNANFVSFEELAKCDIVFIALPTPFKQSTGECDTSIVEKCVAQLRNLNKDNLIVIKSTVPPGTTKKLHFSYGNVWFNPEFLTEANAYNDFVNLEYQIIGANLDNEQLQEDHPLLQLYRDCYKQGIMQCKELNVMTSTSAEMVKYVKNCYLAVRLSYFNEIFQVCEKMDVNYDLVKHYVGLDPRIGNYYNTIDNESHRFYGKACLPKDINAFIHLSKKLGINPNVIEGSWKTNLERSEGFERDWEAMNGRAIVKDDK